jgi:hypothetical protein
MQTNETENFNNESTENFVARDKITLNVGGVKVQKKKIFIFKVKYVLNSKLIILFECFQYETCRSTLTSYQTTLLGSIFYHYNDKENPLADPNHENEFFIDRDGHLFHYIMQFYRTGKVPTIEQGKKKFP